MANPMVSNCVIKDEQNGRWNVYYNGEWYSTEDTYEAADDTLARLLNSEYEDEYEYCGEEDADEYYEEEDADEVERQMWLNEHEYDETLECWYRKE